MSSSRSDDKSNTYTWTTTYATLMSYGQMTGTFASHNSKYDDGEAIYKLPIFNSKEYKTGSIFWLRSVWGHNGTACVAWTIYNSGVIYGHYVYDAYDVRPFIYLR